VFQPTAVVRHRHSDSLWSYFRKKFFIGYWKAQVVRRFPERAFRDSHTPQVMKLQMMLLALALVTAPAIFISSIGTLLPVGLLLLFCLTAIPFLRKVWVRDRAVTLWALPLLVVRAMALGLGYTYGTFRPQAGISGEESTIGGLNFLFKRALDVAGSLVGMVGVLLIGPFIAAAVKLDSEGPLIFKQERIGKGGRPFTVYKFRSMVSGPEPVWEIDASTRADSVLAPKLADDPRLTRVGKVLRRWSLDEIPQFWNVLMGDMSLVGPRPEESRIVSNYTDWHRRRLSVKPGMTGPMQVSGRADLTLDDRVRLELEYIEGYSLLTDLLLLFKTIPAVVKGDGAR